MNARKSTQIMAHRGASAAAPANTVAAFVLARDMGAHAVELDVRQCATGELVVHHDPHLADGRIIAHVDKQHLFAHGYIARRSSHSTGLAVDIGVTGWDFGSPFDYFDRRSWTKSRVRQEARTHRDALVALMRRHGFVNYPREWWHFTFGDAEKAPIYDAVID